MADIYDDNKIAILAPYDDLYNISKRCVLLERVKIPVYKVNTSNFGEITHEFLSQGGEVIISRGNIAKRVSEITDTEVVNIDISGFDILRTLYKYSGCKKPIAIIEGGEIIYGCKQINSLLNLNLNYYQVDCVENFMEQTDKAIRDGMEILMGGSWGLEIGEYLKSNNIKYEVFYSQERSVKSAIGMAKSLYNAKKREKERHKFLETVIEFSQNGIVVTDKEDVIININPAAEKMLNVSKQNIIGKKSKDIFPDLNLNETLLSGIAQTGKRKNISDTPLVIDRIPMTVESENVGVLASIQRVEEIQTLEQNIRRDSAKKGLCAKFTFENILGESDAIKQTIELARFYSKMESTVLITGETGTGKELFAQSIHNGSLRKHYPFVAVNCSALSSSLLESELFGYTEGSFTGARKGGKMGLFEMAHKGTIFLDEISEIDKNMQAKLLRVIQEREVMRIGDDKIIPVDIRIIAATNRDLYEEVQKGNFREDLYYRLNVLKLEIPPLRTRKGDVEVLVSYFINSLNNKFNCNVTGIAEEIIRKFNDYDWPGNVRELQNVCEKIVAFTEKGQIRNKVFPLIADIMHYDKKIEESEQACLAQMEKYTIIKVLKECNGNKTLASTRLGINRTTLNRKLKEL